MARTIETRSLVEGALLAAVAVVLVLGGAYLPVIGLLFTFARPVPVALIYLRHGARSAVLTIVAAGLLLSLFVGPLDALLKTIVLGSLGLTYGFALMRRLTPTQTLMAGSLGMLLSMVATLAATQLLLHVNILNLFVEALRTGFSSSADVYRRLGLPDQSISQLEAMGKSIVNLIPLILPAAVVASAVFYAFLDFEATRLILRRFGYQVTDLPPFAQWRIPSYFIYLWALGVGMLLLYQRTGQPFLQSIGMNLTYLFTLTFTMAGLSLGYYLLRRYGVGKALAVVLLVFSVNTPLLNQLALWAGMFDSIFNYRKLIGQRDARRQEQAAKRQEPKP